MFLRMQTYLEAQWEKIWVAVERGQYVPKTNINNVQQEKVKGSWNEDDKEKVLLDDRPRSRGGWIYSQVKYLFENLI